MLTHRRFTVIIDNITYIVHVYSMHINCIEMQLTWGGLLKPGIGWDWQGSDGTRSRVLAFGTFGSRIPGFLHTLKQLYKTSYGNTHPVAFVYSQTQKVRSMTAITTKPFVKASPGQSRVPGFSSPRLHVVNRYKKKKLQLNK